MDMTLLDRVTDRVTGVFQSVSADPVLLGIMVAIMVIAGILMPAFGFGRLISVTVGALIVFAGAGIVRAIVDGANWQTVATNRFDTFLGMEMGQFLVYFLAFAIVITGVYLVKSLFQRG